MKAKGWLKTRALLALLFFISTAYCPRSAHAQAKLAARPKLVVMLIADEFPYDYLGHFQDKLGTAGLRLLMDAGATFSHCRFNYAVNQTASGQAVIATGAYPWANGIIADSWYDRHKGKTVTATATGDTAVLARNGSSMNSCHQLIGTTIGDQMKLTSNGHSKVFTVALNDKAALILGGKLANNAFWWNTQTGSFAGSSQIGAQISSSQKEFGSPGSPLDSPKANQLVADFAKELIIQEELGQHSDPDLIGINFSATETVGNHYGPSSQQCEDMVLQLDQTIANLLQFLDDKVGLGNCLIVMTADHGVAPIPELLKDEGIDAGRIDPKTFRDQLNSALSSRLGKGEWIEAFEPPNLYLNLNTIDRQERRQPDVEALAAKLVHSIPGTSEVYTAFQLFLNQLPNGATAEAVRRSYFWGRSGELFVTTKPGYIFTVDATGTTSGSSYTYDAQVPLLLYGATIRGGLYNTSVSPADIAPTIASILGLDAPPLSEGRVLSEAIAQTFGPPKPHGQHISSTLPAAIAQ